MDGFIRLSRTLSHTHPDHRSLNFKQTYFEKITLALAIAFNAIFLNISAFLEVKHENNKQK